MLEVLQAALFLLIVAVIVFYFGRQFGRHNRLTVAEITALRNSIELSFTPTFAAQLPPAEFQRMIDRRLELILAYAKNPLAHPWTVPASRRADSAPPPSLAQGPWLEEDSRNAFRSAISI